MIWPVLEVSTDIQKCFCSLFGSNEGIQKSFWNQLTFNWVHLFIWHLRVNNWRKRKHTTFFSIVFSHQGPTCQRQLRSSNWSFFVTFLGTPFFEQERRQTLNLQECQQKNKQILQSLISSENYWIPVWFTPLLFTKMEKYVSQN